MIADRDVAFYRENGYVVVPGVLEPALVESLRREMNEILDKARGLTAHTDVYDLEPGHRPDAPRVRRIKTPHRFLPGFEKLYRNPRLVGIVQKLVGPSVRLHGSKLNMKAPRYGSPVEWHQDWAFYPHTNDDLLAVGVMLDDCTPRERAAPRRAEEPYRPHLGPSRRRAFLRRRRSGDHRGGDRPRRARSPAARAR